MTRFLSDILLPFPNLNDLNSRVRLQVSSKQLQILVLHRMFWHNFSFWLFNSLLSNKNFLSCCTNTNNNNTHWIDLENDHKSSVSLKPCSNLELLVNQFNNVQASTYENKGVRQSHASSWNSEAIDMWKVACHSPSSRALACDNYFF